MWTADVPRSTTDGGVLASRGHRSGGLGSLDLVDQEDLRLRFDTLTKTKPPELHRDRTTLGGERASPATGRLGPRRRRGPSVPSALLGVGGGRGRAPR
jgi:hypothetical protein